MQINITLEQFVKALVDMSDWHSINDGHSNRVSELSVRIGKRLKLSEDELFNLKWGAEIHDIGRVGIEDSILSKRSKLTNSQHGAVKSHSEIGYKIVQNILPKDMTDVILYHQECYDGTGYPKGLKGNDIPLLARICKIADVWDALTSDRPYRKALTFENALHIMNLEVDTFDPKLYPIFLEIIRNER